MTDITKLTKQEYIDLQKETIENDPTINQEIGKQAEIVVNAIASLSYDNLTNVEQRRQTAFIIDNVSGLYLDELANYRGYRRYSEKPAYIEVKISNNLPNEILLEKSITEFLVAGSYIFYPEKNITITGGAIDVIVILISKDFTKIPLSFNPNIVCNTFTNLIVKFNKQISIGADRELDAELKIRLKSQELPLDSIRRFEQIIKSGNYGVNDISIVKHNNQELDGMVIDPEYPNTLLPIHTVFCITDKEEEFTDYLESIAYIFYSLNGGQVMLNLADDNEIVTGWGIKKRSYLIEFNGNSSFDWVYYISRRIKLKIKLLSYPEYEVNFTDQLKTDIKNKLLADTPNINKLPDQSNNSVDANTITSTDILLTIQDLTNDIISVELEPFSDDGNLSNVIWDKYRIEIPKYSVIYLDPNDIVFDFTFDPAVKVLNINARK